MRSFLATAVVVACPLAVLAASIPSPRAAASVLPGLFSLGAWKPTKDCSDTPSFLGNAINASGGKFYVNRNASTYCPEGIPGLDCSVYAGSHTIIAMGNGTASMSLDVTVPGGQLIYIGPDDSLSYTQAHSAYIPAGSTITGFSRAQTKKGGASTYLYSAGRTWYLCPVAEDQPLDAQVQAEEEKTYQVFVSSAAPSGCVSTQVKTFTSEGSHVWQYT